MQREAASAPPRGMALCVVAAYPESRGKRTIDAQPPATDPPHRRAQAGGGLPLPSRVGRGEVRSPGDERVARGQA